jgi:2-polyprenyl-6-methoxyphenol hydroxylase-like FAD-dependent oxidoreductase
MPAPLRAVVIGAGLGGLCLAQGLRRAGLEVSVHERDASLASRQQGYRLHVDARAARGLQACLPAELYELFLATCGAPSKQITVVTKGLRVVKTMSSPAATGAGPQPLSTSADRLTLREILYTGLRDVVQFGQEFTRFRHDPGGQVRAHFSDGTSVAGDILVAADGVGSRVRQQYLPAAAVTDTGTRCIYGKTLISEQTEPVIPAFTRDGFAAVIGSRRVGMALGSVRFRTPPADAARAVPGASLSAEADFVMWSVSGQLAGFPGGDGALAGGSSKDLHDVALEMIRTWHPDLRGLLAAAAVDETFYVQVRAARPVPLWEPTNVTLLGDAIHAMSPARGSGANIALLDAGNLCRNLTRAARGELPLLEAVHAYEAEMVEYGFAAVRDTPAALREGGGGILAKLAARLRRRARPS